MAELPSQDTARLVESMEQFAFPAQTPPPPPMDNEDEAVEESDEHLTLQICITCKEYHPLSNFYNRPQGGVLSKCKACHKEYVKQYKATHPRKSRAEIRQDMERDETPEEVYCQPAETTMDPPPDGPYGDSMYVLYNPRIPGEVKIGRAMRPSNRARDLCNSMPFKLEVMHVFPGFGFLETHVHKKLQHKRVVNGRGREWFAIEPCQADILIKATIVEFQLSM
jgi:T5orf172 domain